MEKIWINLKISGYAIYFDVSSNSILGVLSATREVFITKDITNFIILDLPADLVEPVILAYDDVHQQVYIVGGTVGTRALGVYSKSVFNSTWNYFNFPDYTNWYARAAQIKYGNDAVVVATPGNKVGKPWTYLIYTSRNYGVSFQMILLLNFPPISYNSFSCRLSFCGPSGFQRFFFCLWTICQLHIN